MKIISRRFLFITILAVISTIILTWPFITKLSSFTDDNSDYAHLRWSYWYNFRSIETGRIFNQESYFNTFQYYPLPLAFASNEHLLLPTLLIFPVYETTNNLTFSVNSITFASFILTFLASYYFLSYFLKNKFAVFVGVFIYTYNPLTFAHFPEHIHLMHKYFVPLLFLTALIYVRGPSMKNAFFFFLIFALSSFTHSYYFFFGLLLLPVFMFPTLFQSVRDRRWQYLINLGKTSLIGIPFFLILIWWYKPYLDFSRLEGVSRSIEDNVHNSARLPDWISSNPNNILYGKVFKFIDQFRQPDEYKIDINYAEHTLFPSVLPVILMLLGIFFLMKFRKPQANTVGFAMLLIAAISLSFGPVFLGVNEIRGTVKLPFYYLNELIPFLSGTRAPTRFMFIGYLSIAYFASFGIVYITKLLQNRKKLLRLIFIMLILVLFIEHLNIGNFSLKSQMTAEATALLKKDVALGEKLNKSIVLHLPADYFQPQKQFARYLSWETVTGEIQVNGYGGYFPDDWRNLIKNLSNLKKDNFQDARALGIDYIIIHKHYFDNYSILDIPRKLVTYEDGELIILAVNTLPLPPICSLTRENVKHVRYENTNLDIIFKNGNCYSKQLYRDRYLRVFIRSANRVSKKTLKLPPLIHPLEEVKLNLPLSNEEITEIIIPKLNADFQIN